MLNVSVIVAASRLASLFDDVDATNSLRRKTINERSFSMNTMNTKGIRRKKSSLSEVKVAVVGAPYVGKSGKSTY